MAAQADYDAWKAENLHILREINRELEHTAPLEEVRPCLPPHAPIPSSH